MIIQPGTDIGRYHILEQLGEGGMAVVYKAYDTQLEREVALKILPYSHTQNEKMKKRFNLEAKALAKLDHPNIVRVLDYGEFKEMPYLVMEYVRGGTLKAKIGQVMDFHEAACLLASIADALAYAHGKKILHRDVKPSNILIREDGQPLLSDFGIAKIIESEDTLDLTLPGVGIGTPEYMAPEAGLGKSLDGRADLYSLGVVFYELVTGKKPFTADTPMATIQMQINNPLPDPTRIVRDLPNKVRWFILKALAKDPANRFQSGDEFSGELTRLETLRIGSFDFINLSNIKKYKTWIRILLLFLGAFLGFFPIFFTSRYGIENTFVMVVISTILVDVAFPFIYLLIKQSYLFDDSVKSLGLIIKGAFYFLIYHVILAGFLSIYSLCGDSLAQYFELDTSFEVILAIALFSITYVAVGELLLVPPLAIMVFIARHKLGSVESEQKRKWSSCCTVVLTLVSIILLILIIGCLLIVSIADKGTNLYDFFV